MLVFESDIDDRHVDVFRWCYQHQLCTDKYLRHVQRIVCIRQQLTLLDWLHTATATLEWDNENLLSLIITHRCIKVLRWLDKHGYIAADREDDLVHRTLMNGSWDEGIAWSLIRTRQRPG